MNLATEEAILSTNDRDDVIVVMQDRNLVDAFGDCLATEATDFSIGSDWDPSLIIRTLPDLTPWKSNISTIVISAGDAGESRRIATPEKDQAKDVNHRGAFRRILHSVFSFVKTSSVNISEVIQWTGKVIYVLCPPIPAMMIRKVSFQPPQKGKFYFLLPSEELIPNVRPPKRLISLQDYDTFKQSLSFVFPYLGRNPVNPDYPTSREQIKRLQAHIFPSTSGNRLVGVEIRCARSVTLNARSPMILLFAQPNSSDIGSCMMTDPNMVDICDFLNCDMFAFDYSGFGMSDGSPSEANVYADMESAFEYVQGRFNYDPEDVVPLGFSMGTASSIHLASVFPEIRAMILIAPFTSVLRVIARSPAMEKTPQIDKFRSVDKIEAVEAITLVCHGTKDFIVPMNHGEFIYQKLKNKTDPLWVEEATHQGVYSNRALWNRINVFLNEELEMKSLWEEIV